MDIDALIEMDDDKFKNVVLQAAKRRDQFPDWWRAVLHPDVIDATEQVLLDARDAADVQSLNPGRFPAAAGFARKVDGFLAEVALARIVGLGEG